jgi:hypothetical protein
MEKVIIIMENVIQFIVEFIFGVRASGEQLPPPTLKTTSLNDRPDEGQWNKEFKFGSRYGYRGSFYNQR